MSLKSIRLELARNPDWPNGNPDCGYQFRAPLDADGHIDVDAWRGEKKSCAVHRFWQGEDDEHGHLIHTRHRTWAFSYAPGEDDDTPFFRFESHAFIAGEYVSITEHDGKEYTFLVTAVT
ncbi:MAG: hypothetical protein QF926_01250 [Alphaproteobacteria bacterium]|nr:hypothetical protein [Alphaproteobacteria bacterium]MDP6515236.1 hypothetical protein [Alphaproteobacteria bacterium]